jgi:hypothetical protein
MKAYFKISIFAGVLLLQIGCSPSFFITHKTTNEILSIRAKKINALITVQGLVYEDGITFNDTNLYVNGAKLQWNTISMMEVKRTRFGDVMAFPLEMIGTGGALTGAFLMGGASVVEDVDFFPIFLTGLGLSGAGVLVNRLGHSMRPREKKTIQTIVTSNYTVPTTSWKEANNNKP